VRRRVCIICNTSGKGWWKGDFTYDSVVNFADLVKVAQNYNSSLSAAVPGAPAAFEADWAAAVGGVPEPSLAV
jgi:hypothetical protein